MLNLPETGMNGRLSLFFAPHPRFAHLNDDQREAELDRMRSEDEAATRRAMHPTESAPVRAAPRRHVTRGVVAGSTMLAALVAVIVASGPIQTSGPTGISIRHRDVNQPKVEYAALVTPAHTTGR